MRHSALSNRPVTSTIPGSLPPDQLLVANPPLSLEAAGVRRAPIASFPATRPSMFAIPPAMPLPYMRQTPSPPPAGCFQRVITRPAVELPCIPGRYLPPVVGCDPFLSLEAAGVRASIALLLATRPSIPPAMPLPDWDHVPPPESSARRAGCFKESWPGQPYRWKAPDKTGPVCHPPPMPASLHMLAKSWQG